MLKINGLVHSNPVKSHLKCFQEKCENRWSMTSSRVTESRYMKGHGLLWPYFGKDNFDAQPF